MKEGQGVLDETVTPASWALFILTGLLLAGLWMSYYMRWKRVKAVHETVLSIFMGMGVGLLMGRSLAIRSRVTFQHVYFFNMLLPPIILNSGYELDQKRFFKNAGVIFTFAFAGTFISALVIGLFTYLWTLTGVENIQLSWIDAFIFGATLSATDPVTILSIFQTYGVDPTLYTIIFGESLLNDSVSIIMFGTLQQFYHKKMQVFDIFFGFVNFFVSFIISLVIGTVISILTALMLKHSHIRRFPHIESCIIILMAYASYLFSNGCHMSGIVSLLFCAITLKHYAFHNMSIQTQISTKFLFKTLSQLSENFIFIYLGISLFTQENLVYKPLLILVTIFSVCISRYIVVFPISKLINIISGSSNSFFSDKLPKSYQIMLFWSGLRGAVGVALTEGFKGDSTETLKATVLVVVVLTVIIFGGTAPQILEIVGIRIGIFQNEDYHIEYFYDKPIKLQEGMQDEFKNINKDSFLSNNHKMNPDNYDSHLNFNQPDSPDPIHHSYYSYESPKQTKSEDSDHASVNTDIFFPSNSFKSTYLDEDVYFTPAQYKTENRETFIESSQTSPGNHIKWFLNFDSKVLKPLVLEKDIFTKENDKKNPL